ncbi:DMT family transporter [Bacteriovorax sp. Seq25_V]|uniref:DMT family transporter n=1 Tax=Bacteriovorax sp. Seq25_V TaxID=1201288 RepID=UPI00038A3465|nr:DMT family transporter [Bacteriovorax sp. Seq25_V]EQC44059.1 EamA-like transporter family protein [Bacteriovorax sp. Seq25_V]
MESYILLGLGANFCFALATIIFTHFSNKVSSSWMNCAKASIACVCFFIFILSFEKMYAISTLGISLFFISGFIGLGVGDIFLLKSFSILGPGRTLMLFGFQPVFLGAMGKLLFNQDMELGKIISVIFFICCLITLSFESFRKDKSWGVKGMAIALLGMSLDSIGVLLTRHAFDISPGLSAMQGNLYRCLGAISVFVIMSFFRPLNFFSTFKSFTAKEKGFTIFGSILGTFLSLSLYLRALQTAHLGTLSGINITGTLFSSLFESIFLKRKPTISLFIALGFFICGMWSLISF